MIEKGIKNKKKRKEIMLVKLQLKNSHFFLKEQKKPKKFNTTQ